MPRRGAWAAASRCTPTRWTKRWRCPPNSLRCSRLRTQQIIAHETGVANTVDPVGGSYAIEKLTNEIEAGAREYIAKIDAMGGMLRAIETGYVQQEIQKSAYEYQQAVERGEQIVVGVNRFHAEEEQPIPTLRIDPEIERAQVARLQALRARRDATKAQRRARGSRAPRARRRKSDARDSRRRRSLRHGRRNFRRAAPRLRRIPGIHHPLSIGGTGPRTFSSGRYTDENLPRHGWRTEVRRYKRLLRAAARDRLGVQIEAGCRRIGADERCG